MSGLTRLVIETRLSAEPEDGRLEVELVGVPEGGVGARFRVERCDGLRVVVGVDGETFTLRLSDFKGRQQRGREGWE